MYVIAIEGVVTKYPYTLTDMRLDNPTVSFSDTIPDETAASFNVFPVVQTPAPSYDSLTQDLIWVNPIYENGSWVQQWRVDDISNEEAINRLDQKRQGMVVTPFQAKAALHSAGLLDDVTALMNDPTTDPLVVLAWNNATEFRRTSSMVETLATKLNINPNQLDTLFNTAATITA